MSYLGRAWHHGMFGWTLGNTLLAPIRISQLPHLQLGRRLGLPGNVRAEQLSPGRRQCGVRRWLGPLPQVHYGHADRLGPRFPRAWARFSRAIPIDGTGQSRRSSCRRRRELPPPRFPVNRHTWETGPMAHSRFFFAIISCLDEPGSLSIELQRVCQWASNPKRLLHPSSRPQGPISPGPPGNSRHGSSCRPCWWSCWHSEPGCCHNGNTTIGMRSCVLDTSSTEINLTWRFRPYQVFGTRPLGPRNP